MNGSIAWRRGAAALCASLALAACTSHDMAQSATIPHTPQFFD